VVRSIGVAVVLLTGSVCWAQSAKQTSECERQVEDLKLRNEALVRELAGHRGARHGFGRTRWGMGAEEVKRLYPDAQTSGDARLISRESVAGHPASTAFDFLDGKLRAVTVVFTDPSAGEGPVSTFSDVKGQLADKYGNPETDDMRWAQGEASGGQEPTRAVAQGHLSFLSRWQTAQMQIALELRGSNAKPQLELRYESRDRQAAAL